MKRLAKLVCAVAAMVVTSVLMAVEVTSEQACTAVQNWIRRNPSPMATRFVSENGVAKTYSKNGKALFHVVQLKGEGFVVTSGDTRQSPIVAFSTSGCYEEDELNPLYAILQEDQSNIQGVLAQYEKMDAVDSQNSRGGNVFSEAETEWDRLLSDEKSNDMEDNASATSISDVRVDKLIKTQWGQSKWGGNSSAPKVFNFNTPSNYVCGCVATAGAQIMKYWEMPKDYIGSFSNTCRINGISETKYSIAGIYDWDNMPCPTL